MNGYNNVFENSISNFNKYIEEKKELEQLFNNFYLDYKKFGFIHNGDFPPDLEAIEICNKINSDLYEKYICSFISYMELNEELSLKSEFC